MAKPKPLAVTYVPTSSLKPYERNARTHSDEQIKLIADLIQRFGWTNPILTDGKKGIIAGHGRLAAARLLKLDKVPTIEIGHLTKDEKRAYILADNASAARAGWSEELLRAELGALQLAGFDLALTGFEASDIRSLLAEQGKTDPDETPPAPANPVSRAGDLWLLGEHRLLCGSSVDEAAVTTLFAGQHGAMMFTDPPYGVAYRDAGAGAWNAAKLAKKKAGTLKPRFAAIANDEMAGEALTEFWVAFLTAGAAALVARGAIYCCFASLRGPEVFAAFHAAGYEPRAELIWVKSRPGFNFAHYKHQHEPILYGARKKSPVNWYGDRAQVSVLSVASESGADYEHPTQKPVALVTTPINNSSRAGEIVYEPFSGSGTTIIAAEMTGRRCYAIEIAPQYVDVAVLRWQQFTGKEATLEATGQTYAATAAARSRAKPVRKSRPRPDAPGVAAR